MSDPRSTVCESFARWAALSALRSGSPVKSRQDIYPLIARQHFQQLLDEDRGPIAADEFERWHRGQIHRIQEKEGRLPVGWAAKLLNVYLKVRVYLAGEGRSGLVDLIHPRIDGGLRRGLRGRFGDCDAIISKTNAVKAIKRIDTYELYSTIIDGCRLAADALGCKLIEVEQLWRGADTPA